MHIKTRGATNMPSIRPSSDLRNKYSEISEFCHKNGEPVYITKNGQGDLVLMSMETFDKLINKSELYKLLDEGYDAMKKGNVKPATEVFDHIERKLSTAFTMDTED